MGPCAAGFAGSRPHAVRNTASPIHVAAKKIFSKLNFNAIAPFVKSIQAMFFSDGPMPSECSYGTILQNTHRAGNLFSLNLCHAQKRASVVKTLVTLIFKMRRQTQWMQQIPVYVSTISHTPEECKGIEALMPIESIGVLGFFQPADDRISEWCG